MNETVRRETIEERWQRMGPPQRLLVPPPPPPTREEVEALVKLGPRRYEYHLVSLSKDDE